MKVLIAEFDLFHHVGGGQTAYRRLIETNPAIKFWYLGRDEPSLARRPPNAQMVPYREVYRGNFANRPRDTHPPHWAYSDFVQASNVAVSVAGQEFDVVELADFRHFGSMLRPALAQHGVRVGRTVLSMHGTLSTSLALDWPNPAGVNLTLDLQEKVQFRAMDTRYGISRSYLDEWRAVVDLDAHYLHPLRLLELARPTLAEPAAEPPSVNFIGRTEKRKGPDIFVELTWWLPRDLFSTASIIGPQSYTEEGCGSNVYLKGIVANRRNDVTIRPTMTPQEMAELYAGRTLIFLPSRYDTLNLLALESLFAGCPTVIGSGAGVCRFLRDSFPHVPFVEMDMSNIYGCLPEVRAVLQNYDHYRERLVEAVQDSRPDINGLTLEKIYNTPPCPDSPLRKQMDQWYGELMRHYRAASRSPTARMKWAARRVVRAVVPRKARARLRELRARAYNALLAMPETLRNMVARSIFRGDAAAALYALRGRRLARRYKSLLRLRENSQGDLAQKMSPAWLLAQDFRIDRARIWTEIARLERMRSNDLVAATYELRVMRALGEDRLALLPAVVATLQKHGYDREAQVAQAMFGPPESRRQACTALLENALLAHEANPSYEFERIDDRRQAAGYRVSIIVSLYQAADKLSFFLHALGNQTLFKKRGAEVILIDSGSPDREYEVFQTAIRALSMPVVYARSAARETIQNAWNRGILLSRAPYLAFLGVDEMVLPDALEVLADELDRDPTLDWVQSSSLVTAVDRHGTWKQDVMTYDRSEYQPTLSYLDTCYLTHVGSLYRRTIHERCGYYDISFGAAGDTEFKNRVLPFIKTKTLLRTLGIFWNYPGERTTESPRAELEDLRAWYLHRTLAGVDYAFARRDPQEAVDLFYKCLRYRKSFCRHWSTDVEYADNLAGYLTGRSPGALEAGHLAAVGRVLAAYRSLDWLLRLSRWMPARQLLRVRRAANRAEAQHRTLGPPGIEPLYGIFNDNRYEQHTHVWRSAAG